MSKICGNINRRKFFQDILSVQSFKAAHFFVVFVVIKASKKHIF